VVSELVPDPGSSDQRPPARRDVRVSDLERRAVVDELREHFGAGRLDLAEFEDRTNAALVARVRGELEPLLDDLPELRPFDDDDDGGPPIRRKPPQPPGYAALRIHTNIWLALSAFFLMIWVGTLFVADGVPFWPIFPIAAIGLSVGNQASLRKGLEG
jgi:hypothetical protein